MYHHFQLICQDGSYPESGVTSGSEDDCCCLSWTLPIPITRKRHSNMQVVAPIPVSVGCICSCSCFASVPSIYCTYLRLVFFNRSYSFLNSALSVVLFWLAAHLVGITRSAEEIGKQCKISFAMKIVCCKLLVICRSLDKCAKYKLKLLPKAKGTWRFSAFAKGMTSTTTRSFLAYIVAQGKLTWKYGEEQVSYPQVAAPLPPLVGTKVIGPRSSDCPISTMLYNEWWWGWRSLWKAWKLRHHHCHSWILVCYPANEE